MSVYHLFARNNVGTIEYRSINKNKLSDGLTGAERVSHITFELIVIIQLLLIDLVAYNNNVSH